MSERMHKYFGCTCGSLDHIFSLSYFSPMKEETKEDDVIYLSIKNENFRKKIIPAFWSRYFWEDIFDKDSITNFYYYSFWKKIKIAYDYLADKKELEGGILDCIVLYSDYKEDLLEFLSVFDDVEIEEDIDITSCEIENDEFRLIIEAPKEEQRTCCEDEFEILETSFQFKRKKGIKKLWEAIKYIFKSYRQTFCFEITPEKASHLKKIIQKTVEDNKNAIK